MIKTSRYLIPVLRSSRQPSRGALRNKQAARKENLNEDRSSSFRDHRRLGGFAIRPVQLRSWKLSECWPIQGRHRVEAAEPQIAFYRIE